MVEYRQKNGAFKKIEDVLGLMQLVMSSVEHGGSG
jgi:DNA uptake protein ComE-like DNA-binding protein